MLAGGVGGARFLRGLSRVTDPRGLTVVGNTGDDEEFFGLHVAPDLDTVVYTLGGHADPVRGLVVHGMAGFDYAKARAVLGIPDDFKVKAMAAVGKPGRREDLPEDFQARESPNTRKPLSELVFEGPYRG